MCDRRVRGVVLILLLAMAASACSGPDDISEAGPTGTDDDPGAAAGGSDPSNDDDEQNDDATDATGTGDEAETLADYLPADIFSVDPQERAANYARKEQKVQELIARCMAAEGFEYIPVVTLADPAEFASPGDVEYARVHGFGISTDFFETGSYSDDDPTDPNEAIVESLSETERDVYDAMLNGDPVDDFDGCSGQAYEEVFLLSVFLDLYEQLDQWALSERIEADPRIVESYSEWSECMAERGYDYEDPDALIDTVYGDLETRFNEIVGGEGGFVDPFQGMSREEIDGIFESLSPEELDDFFAQREQEAMAAVDREALEALQAEERALAVAYAECFTGLSEHLVELSREYEAEFVNENRALLEQFRDRREN